MTSKAIRDDIDAQWPSKVPFLPLIDDKNINPKDGTMLPAEFARVGYAGSSERPVSIGAFPTCWRENGSIVMRVYVKSGTSSSRAFELAEQVKSAWEGYIGLAGYFNFLSISPPQDLADGESDGDWYPVQVEVAYFYDTFK